MLWISGPQKITGSISGPCTLPIVRQWPLETSLRPVPLHSLVIHAPAVKPQPPVGEPTASAEVALGQLTNQPFELLLLDAYQRVSAPPGVSVLATQAGSTTMRNPVSILLNHHGPATKLRA